ncbi:Uncharacterized conserved protein, DUF2141 family [Pustulibacterium marinum]|uniref:Uncharacterized conserved protein, DUF2141 family n=1 Tax=Pustulibacterium marinum TaxID=1224947 RepID=A0A1I7H3Q5_9FLAO|nr:DUF2141 domain-containing protein [Pustulibacterium marinum]SFU55339.1 Uncharacterized conserved protein, DUF2141 family [Pustulibacterium marinum]
MKTLATLLFIIVSSVAGFAQTNEGISITATVENAHNNNGKVIFALHDKSTFMKGKGVMNATSTINDGVATVTFENVTPGTYAILVLHDENDNDRMDYAATGMPQEDYGMSNNIVAFGPPQFMDAKFEVTDKDQTFNIRF